MGNNILADGVKFAPHIKAFNDLVEERFNGVDKTPLLVYLLDTVPETALPYLAEQFDVLGIKGWKYADTEQKKRDLIKKAVELHRYKGTPWSIKEALKSIGVQNATIIEGGTPHLYDGQHLHNGDITYGYFYWAIFRVLIDIDSFPAATADVIEEMRQLISEYKNERSWLTDISFLVNDTDTIAATEDFELGYDSPNESLGNGIYYSGAAVYDGLYYHNNDREVFTVNIINVP